jgi:hypothetical protein
VGYVPHLLLGHALPLVLTIVVGAMLGGLLLSIRSRSLVDRGMKEQSP